MTAVRSSAMCAALMGDWPRVPYSIARMADRISVRCTAFMLVPSPSIGSV